MRPRPDAAENPITMIRRCGADCRFNEAAARCRGKPAAGREPLPDVAASMRPRPDAAENVQRFNAFTLDGPLQ